MNVLNGVAYDAERLAAVTWSYLAMGMDERAHAVVAAYGYVEALDRVAFRDTSLKTMVGEKFATWCNRLDKVTADSPQSEWLRALERLDTVVLIPSDDLWPEMLNDLGDKSPLALWVRGDPLAVTRVLGKNARRSVSFVGSRASSSRGMRTALDMAYELSPEYTIASGGAFGIDAAAHKGALAAQGDTVIFSAAGVDRVYPGSHADLYKQVWKGGGLVISEYPLGASPHAHRFLQRNRLIAAFSHATIVVEAPVRSGALSTARWALDIGRNVGAVPGMIDSPYSAGCHELIRNGGTLVASTNHVRELVNPIGTQLSLGDADVFAGEDKSACSEEGTSTIKNVSCENHSDMGDFFTPPQSAVGGRGQRVLDAVPKQCGHDIASIARESGVSMDAVRAELGKLALIGLVANRAGLWIKTVQSVDKKK